MAPRFLKKIGDPETVYIYTDGLMARGDMEPYEPEEQPQLVDILPSTEGPFTVKPVGAEYCVVDGNDKVVSKRMKKRNAQPLADELNGKL